jgi:hypothetical protein
MDIKRTGNCRHVGQIGLLGIGLSLIFIATSTQAVILYGTGDPTANISAPAGALANSGWQYEGQFGDFLGQPSLPTTLSRLSTSAGASAKAFS